MFYSESLLAKTGPLARVWLASNFERKLTKQGVLQSNLEDNVKNIVGQGQAPMALRLSGQLLLGVVRIYSRKARYLLNDCSEALSKLKMAFKPGNVDLPGGQSHAAAPGALILPDTITELDLLAPLPDPDLLLLGPSTGGRNNTTLDFGASQLLPDSQVTPSRRHRGQALRLEDDDLGLDLGFGPDELANKSTPFGEDRSIEIGRRAATPRNNEPTLLEDDDLGLDLGFGDTTLGRDSTVHAPQDDFMPMVEDDYQMGDVVEDVDEIAQANAEALARASAHAASRLRNSESPLSSVRSSIDRQLEKTFQLDLTAMEEQDPTIVQAAQRIKRRRVLPQDTQIELHNSQIKHQQEDRSAITRAPEFLPRDPLLLQLMEMQRNGGFVSNIMGDGRMQGWAPELRGILSVDVVRKANKRKRDSGIADVETGSERQETPRLELPLEEDEGFQQPDAFGADATEGAIPFQSDGLQPLADDFQPIPNDDVDYTNINDVPFDITEAPLLRPSQAGPVSLGTKTAVHLLRNHFAPGHAATSAEPPTPSKRTRNEALFTDLCPEATTSRQDATKMFFELLVLGTKDAVKVEQGSDGLGLPIRVRGKRGLWGDWAELGTQQVVGGEGAVEQEV
nr:hypothetical protein B0A51_15748 [Rachicladosporium sp. CCFEE 5018]